MTRSQGSSRDSSFQRLFEKAPQDAAPGTVRCPGPSSQDVIARDGWAPAALRAQRFDFPGSGDVALERYTSPRFHELEIERLWCRTWQWACREEWIAQPGDYYVYDIDRYSVLVVRGADGLIRAFVNSCPHRAMQFVAPGERGSGKQFLRCPFHGMSWELDGGLREIPCRWDFAHVEDSDFDLPEVPTASWGGFVFINLDADAAPLEDHLQVLPEHFAEFPLERRFTTLHTEKILPGNWKMCMEGFLEAYHVLATHPEGLRTSAWANTQYDLFSPHVSRFLQTLSAGNPHFGSEVSEDDLYRQLGHAEALPDGVPARNAHADRLRETLGAQMGVDLSATSNSQLLDSIEYHLFPNACFFPGITIPLIYRFRPLGHDRCIHDVLLLQPLPDSGEIPAPAPVERLDIDDTYADSESWRGQRLGAVLDQDTDNFHRQWAGMNASLKGSQTLANYQEARIRHFHAALDAWLAVDGAVA
ncbi:MAG: aromatic ring-hydroxylating dioxygenase subunit alpha [Pseudomonadota bacterium]